MDLVEVKITDEFFVQTKHMCLILSLFTAPSIKQRTHYREATAQIVSTRLA